MNAGEPPDETGESEGDEGSTDPDRDAVASDGDAADSQEDADASGGNGDGLDPAQEVEAAVEDVMGPGALEGDGDAAEGEDESENGEEIGNLDESASSDGDLPSDGAADGDAESEPGGETPGDDADGDSADVDGDEDENGVESGDGGRETGEVGDEGRENVESGEGNDGGPVPGDGDSFRRDEPLPVDDDPAGDDEVDESAAVQAAQELVDEERSGGATDGQGAADAGDGDRSATAEDGDESTAAADTEAGAAPMDDAAVESGPVQGADGVEAPAEDVPDDGESSSDDESQQAVPADVRKYDRFKKIDGGTYDRANEFLRDRTYVTAREWAMARLCADFRTETGVEMTKIGENLPELVPFMTDTYTPQAVNQARAAFEEKVRKAGATFLYGAMCDFFTAEELDDVMYEATEVAKFLLEVEGVELSVEEELAAEDHISEVMRDVREHSAALRHDEVTCPECGHEIGADD